MKKKELGNRVHLIDEVRGFAIICMVVYHMFYDLVVIFGVDIPLFYTDFINGLVSLFAGLFIFISGTACLFSRNNLKRGGICFLLGLGMTLVTFIAVPESPDWFGILHMLGVCMMLFAFLAPVVKRIEPVWGMLGCLLIAFFTFSVQNGYLGFEGIFQIELPVALYQTSFLFPLGFPSMGFSSLDYFPLLPWFFVFYAGTFFGVIVKEKKLPAWFYRMHLPPLAFVGRHTLIVYILHQPVVLGILWVIFSMIR